MLQLHGGLSELNFGYTVDMGGYANMSSNIQELSDMAALVYIGR